MIDPRLFKLALFNMFANSLKAIRASGEDGAKATGWIRAQTRRSGAGGLEIGIEDSGSGILGNDGRPLSPPEIPKIFELGYTRFGREEGSGEGLGLNWVRTIIENLHEGSIRAENIPGAGARFVIELPPLDRAPYIANTERKAKEDMRQFGRQRAASGADPAAPTA
jgi:signal transduction histidine kinase